MTEKNAGDGDSKKDLTSLVELSALEMAKAPPDEAQAALEAAAPLAPVTEADFGSLEELSAESNLAADLPAVPVFNEQPPMAPPPDAIPPMDFAVDETPEINALELPPLAEQPETETPVPVEVSAPLEVSAPVESQHFNEAPPDLKKRQMFAQETAEPPHLSAEEAAEPALVAPPATLSKTKKSEKPLAGKQDFENVKKFGDRLSIGKPKVDAMPAFSVLLKSRPGGFTEKEAAEIKDILDADDYGVRYEDVAMQVSAGKLLLPQVSEFAAITFAQKVREFTDSIELDLAGEIFKSSGFELTKNEEHFWMDREHFYQSQEEVRDMSTEPKSERDLFSSNMAELSGYQITRILSAVTASEILAAEIAEKRDSGKFEAATDRLTRELLTRAFKLGAHGVIGIAFTLKPIDVHKDDSGKVGRAYRLLGSGTAVRARRK